jgi:ATP phosphoribosyltransferase regulatory subunit
MSDLRLEALDQASRAITGVFAARGYGRVAPPVLQPADVFLDLLGDSLRTDTYVFADPGGVELCLRPDFTIAACRLYLARKAPPRETGRLWYDGPIYRYPAPGTDQPNELRHAGVELLGAADREAADVEVLKLAADALAAAGVKRMRLRFGDLSLFSALVDAIDLPTEWRVRLRRHFVRPDDFTRLLGRLSAGKKDKGRTDKGPRALVASLGRLSEAEARAVIADVLQLADIEAVGSRSVDEIAERLLEQAADASALALGPPTTALIERFLQIAGTPDAALSELSAFAKASKLDLDAALARLERRFALMKEAGIDLAQAEFATIFGRRIGYYSGFIFGIERGKGKDAVPLASGGRYDGLLRALGSTRDIPAVGAAVFCDTVAGVTG